MKSTNILGTVHPSYCLHYTLLGVASVKQLKDDTRVSVFTQSTKNNGLLCWSCTLKSQSMNNCSGRADDRYLQYKYF